MKLVQMPTDLLHLDDADLDAAEIDGPLLAAFRRYLPGAAEDRRGLVILAPASAGAHRLLMVLARRIGVALRDANIHLRERGGDLKADRQKLCYLPGRRLGLALTLPEAHAALRREAACFFQDLDHAWSADDGRRAGDRRPTGPSGGLDGAAASEYADETPLDPNALLGLLDVRAAARRPTFLNAAPDRLPPGLEDALRARLPILEVRCRE